MALKDFDGKTFVAFLDISGFKRLMKNEEKAIKTLDNFYQTGFDILKNQNNNININGTFFSDSGLLYLDNNLEEADDKTTPLNDLLKVIKNINKKILENDKLLTTSIAYGDFKYEDRLEFPGIDKNPVYGFAYVNAFLDNEENEPKIQPGECRLVKKKLPDSVKSMIENGNQRTTNDNIDMIFGKEGDEDHYYFYWMRDHPDEIKEFNENYKNALNIKYEKIKEVLKGEN